MSEQRRLIEGKAHREKMKRDRRLEEQGKDPAKEEMKQQSKRRARQRMIEKVD